MALSIMFFFLKKLMNIYFNFIDSIIGMREEMQRKKEELERSNSEENGGSAKDTDETKKDGKSEHSNDVSMDKNGTNNICLFIIFLQLI